MAQAAAAVLQVGGTLFAANNEKKSLKEAARADEENARLSELSGAFESEQIRKEARALDGEAIVASAANGVAVGSGSAADVLTQSAIDREHAILTTRYNAGAQAHELRVQGRQKRKAARAAMIGGIIKAGAQALSAASDMQAASAAKKAGTGGTPLPTPKGPK